MTEQEDYQLERLRNLALSGGLTGAVVGGLSSAFGSKFNRLRDLVSPALKGAAITGSVAAGSGYVGDEILGEPEADESNPYTKRTGLGGLAIGTGAGAALGGIAGSGLLNKTITSHLPEGNFIRNRILEMQRAGKLKSAGKLGAIGAALGGIGLGLHSADEGMALDVLMAERKKRMADV